MFYNLVKLSMFDEMWEDRHQYQRGGRLLRAVMLGISATHLAYVRPDILRARTRDVIGPCGGP
jgi:hypothetical protein